ncbi:MAG: protoporphyrinogen oxidase, partial [Halothiobacillus sp. 28-55-5]
MNSNAPRTRVDTLIIGAGLTGLSAGYHLTKHGEQVIILEAATRVGGAVGSVIEAGWLRELGPNSLMQTEALAQLLSELDLSAETIEANPIAKKRFVAKNGHPVALPANPLELLSSPLFSLGDLFHLAREPWIKPAKTEESIAQFVRRRLGQGFLDWAVDPFVSGVYAGDPNRLSARAAIPKIYAMEQENGSLIRAGIARM